ncbi:hypothetical protein UlMin_031458 [Ulmus minor]
MALKRAELGLVLVLAAVLLGGAAAQQGCTTALMNMAPCLNYISGSSSNPSSSCCSQLSGVVQQSPQCLCSVLNGGAASLGITINQTQALKLPGACKVNTPPLGQCKAANAPTGSTTSPPADSPAISPADSSNDTPNAAITPSASNIPSGGGSKSVPSTEGGSSDGSSIKAPLHFVLFVFFIVSCASTITVF